MDEKRFIDIEIKLSQQENTIETLNEVVFFFVFSGALVYTTIKIGGIKSNSVTFCALK